MGKSNKFIVWIIGGVILVAILWRMSFVIWNIMPFDADEAIVGLMAKHILAGERPLFFYGQYYMGSLDAYFVSLGFLALGQKVWVIRLVQTLLLGGTIYLVMKVGEEAYGNLKIGFVAGLLLAIPNVNLLVYSTASLGGYGEALLFSVLVMWIAFRLKKHLTAEMMAWPKTHGLFILLGVVSGLAFWVNFLSAVVTFPCIVFVFIYLFRATLSGRAKLSAFLLLALGFVVGLTPILISLFQNGVGPVVRDLSINISTSEVGSALQKIGNHIFSFFFLGIPALFGIRAPWDVRWLATPLVPFLLLAFIAAITWTILFVRKHRSTQSTHWLFASITTFFFLLFVFTPFGLDPTGRYFLPLNLILSLMIANFAFSATGRKWVGFTTVFIILAFNIWSTLQCALQNPPGITLYLDSTNRINHRADPELISFLEANKIDRGYSTYWVSYPIAFLSNEEQIFLPQLPYHTSMLVSPRYDRYEPYDPLVENAPNVAYITVRFPELNNFLRMGFERLQITWYEKVIGDYRIFYDLSKRVTPQDLGFEFEQ